MHDTGASLEIVRAGPAGFTPADSVGAGGQHYACAAVSGRPDGAALIGATDVDAQGRQSIAVANRAAGGAFGAPVAVARVDGYVDAVVATLSERGDALVAWEEMRGSRVQVRAVLRPSGGAFGPPVALARAERQAPIALAALGPSLAQAQQTYVATALTPDGVVAAWIGFAGSRAWGRWRSARPSYPRAAARSSAPAWAAARATPSP